MRNFLSFIFILLTFSTGYSESLSDINISRLQEPVKERWGRDPFLKREHRNGKMKEGIKEPALQIKIDGIISDGKKSLVIINGGFYRAGDRIQDFVIKDISNERVLIEGKGKKYYFGIDKFAFEGGRK